MTDGRRRRGGHGAGEAALDTTGMTLEQMRSLVVDLEDRHRRVAERLAYGYGYDSEIPGWFAQIRRLEADLATLRAAISAAEAAEAAEAGA